MTVKELKEYLLNYPDSYKVLISTEGHDEAIFSKHGIKDNLQVNYAGGVMKSLDITDAIDIY